MMEKWKEIKGYEGLYEVSTMGRVRRLPGKWCPSGRMLTPTKTTQGYMIVGLSNGKSKSFNVHWLMAVAFLNYKPNGHYIAVDHINSVKWDNRIENLRIVTQRENLSKDKVNKHGYTGVYKSGNGFATKININGKERYLGYAKTAKEASKIYQEAVRLLNERKYAGI